MRKFNAQRSELVPVGARICMCANLCALLTVKLCVYVVNRRDFRSSRTALILSFPGD